MSSIGWGGPRREWRLDEVLAYGVLVNMQRGLERSALYLLRDTEVSSTSLINAGRVKPMGSTGGVFMTEGGGTNPRDPFTVVFEPPGSIPLALSIASRSLPGAGGPGGPFTGICCGCDTGA